MKITIAKRTTGLIWVILFIFIPVTLLAAYLLYKLWHWKPRYDPTHGIGDPETNLVDHVIDPNVTVHPAQQYGANATIFVPEFNLTLPIEALAYEWFYTVQTSTNLHDWTTSPLDWHEALEVIRTNHNEPARFYRLQVAW